MVHGVAGSRILLSPPSVRVAAPSTRPQATRVLLTLDGLEFVVPPHIVASDSQHQGIIRT
jgi:hypothetical protein